MLTGGEPGERRDGGEGRDEGRGSMIKQNMTSIESVKPSDHKPHSGNGKVGGEGRDTSVTSLEDSVM